MPQTPEVQAEDVAMRVKRSVPPKMNKVIGTDKPQKKKFKPENTANTSDPSYLKPLTPPKGVAVAKGETPYLDRLLEFFSKDIQHPDEIALEKFSVPSMAAFGLGYYLSDSMTRDDKDKYTRQLEAEWERTLKRQDGNSKPIKKSSFEKLSDWWLEQQNVRVLNSQWVKNWVKTIS